MNETESLMRFFIAGIMQGSLIPAELHAQNYRRQIKQLLLSTFDNAEVYDPLANHNQSIDYDDDTGRDTFFNHNRMCREVDCLVAFTPTASMGTAIEMWEAFRSGKIVITISPMVHNWVVKFCSHLIIESVEQFEQALNDGTIKQLIANHSQSIDPRVQ